MPNLIVEESFFKNYLSVWLIVITWFTCLVISGKWSSAQPNLLKTILYARFNSEIEQGYSKNAVGKSDSIASVVINRWVSNGPYGGNVDSLAIDPVNPMIIYAGADPDGVFKSTDGGASWHQTGLRNFKQVFGLAIDPQNSSTVYAATNGAPYKSTDRGETWVEINSGLPNLSYNNIIIDQETPSTLYVTTIWNTTGAGIYKSTDGGDHWTQLSLGGRNVGISSIAISPQNSAVIYAGSSGIYKSTDGGASWLFSNIGLPTNSVYDLDIDPNNPAVIYATTISGGTYKSVNAGTTWNRIDFGLPLDTIALAVDPSNSSILYAGAIGGGGVFKSTDGGAHWVLNNTGISEQDCTVVVVSPTNPSVLYAGTRYAGTKHIPGVFKSTDSGATWDASSQGLTALQTRGLAIDPTNQNIIFSVGSPVGVFKSNNNGAGWSASNTGLTLNYSNTVVVDRANPSRVLLGTFAGVVRSTDGGLNWSRSGLEGSNIEIIAIAGGTHPTIYAGTSSNCGSGSGVFKSTDGGVTWNPTGLSNFSVRVIAVDPILPSTLYAVGGACSSSGLFKSTNEGVTWSRTTLISSFNVIAVDPSNSSILYAGGGSGVFKSTDGGANWSSINNGMTGGPSFRITSLVIDPTNSSTIYVGADNSVSIYKSTNGGASWSSFNEGLTSNRVYSLVIDSLGKSLQAGTEAGVFTFRYEVSSTPTPTPTPNVPPTAGFTMTSGTLSAIEGQTLNITAPTGPVFINFSANRSSDPDGSVIGWQWKIDNTNVSSAGSFSYGLNNGTHSVSLVVADNQGAQSQLASGQIIITSPQPPLPSWQKLSGLPAACENSFGAIAVDPTNPNIIYLGNSNKNAGCGIYKSTDGGVSWIAKNNGIRRVGLIKKMYPAVSRLVIAPSNHNVIYVATFNDTGFGTAGYLYRSVDSGNTWVDARGTSNFFGVTQIDGGVVALDVDLVDPFTVYAGVANQGVFKTSNGGAEWHHIRTEDNNIYFHTVKAGVGSNVFVAGGQVLNDAPCLPIIVPTPGGKEETPSCSGVIPLGPFESVNGGTSWLNITLPARVFLSDFAIDHQNPSTLYFSTIGAGATLPIPILIDPKGLFKSTDSGNTWTQINNGLPTDITRFPVFHIAIDPGSSNKLFLIGGQSKLYQSSDAGQSWAPLFTPGGVKFIQGLTVGPDHSLYLLTAQGIYAMDL